MGQALRTILQYPTQIEADLRGRGDNIADWHQGTRDEHGRLKLSSRALIVILENLPDTSAFARAVSDTGWSEVEQTLAQIQKATEINTRSKFVDNPEAYDDAEWRIPPKGRVARFLEQMAEERFTEATFEQFSDYF